MPHLGMAIQNYSDMCCCNVNKESWQNSSRQTMNCYTDDIGQSFHSHTRKMIAAALDHGRQHSSCSVCWDLESVGNVSRRQIFNAQFQDVSPLPDQPRVLIMKPGNTCNFACRMCNPVTSSSWYSDGLAIEQAGLTSTSWYQDGQASEPKDLTFNQYTRTFELIRNTFGEDNKLLWDRLKSWMPGLVYIDIYGGEPFLIPAMFDLLKHGVDVGASSNISISIHTNGSIYNQQFLDILSAYKMVQFRVSIDSMDRNQLEYIRYKSQYDQIVSNTEKFRTFADQHDNIDMRITCTVTPLNVYYIDEIIGSMATRFQTPVNLNIVTTPEYDIRHIPMPVKDVLTHRTQEPTVKQFLSSLIPGCDVEWPKFCRTTDLLDRLRGQQFKATFAEWWGILEPHWVSK